MSHVLWQSFDCQHGGFVNWPVFLYHIQTHHMSPFHLTIETVPARSVVAHTQRYAPPPPPTHPLVPAPRQPYNAAHNQAVAPTPMLAEAFVGPPRLEMARPSHHAEGAFVAQGSSGPPSDAAASPTRTASSSAAVGPAHIVETVYRDPRNRKELNAQVNKLAHRAEALSGAHGNPNKLNIQCPIQGCVKRYTSYLGFKKHMKYLACEIPGVPIPLPPLNARNFPLGTYTKWRLRLFSKRISELELADAQ